MSKKLLCFVLGMVVMGSAAFAAQTEFTDAGDDHFWSNPDNWASWPLLLANTPRFDTAGTVCIVDIDDGPYASIILSKGPPQGSVVQFANTLSTAWMNIGRADFCDGLYHIYGGTLSATGTIDVPNDPDGKGQLLVMGGLVEAAVIDMDAAAPNSKVDVRGGRIVTAGDDSTAYQAAIDDGRLIAYGGAPGASVVMDYNGSVTIVMADSGLGESPADKAAGVSPGSVALTWTTPDDPNFAGLDKYVYFGEAADLNWSDLNDPNVEAGFWADRDNWVADAGLPVAEVNDLDNSTIVSVVSDKDYYWQLDYGTSPDNVVFSYLFTFDTKNIPPVVDAGYNQYSFLVGGTRTLTLDGSLVEDDGAPAPAEARWSVVSALTPYEIPDDDPVAIDPGQYSFADPNVYAAEFTVTQAGTYILELDADDGELTAEFPQEVTLFVRDTACQAAQIYPGYNDGEPGAIKQLIGDINLDCLVDLVDQADLASTWLDDSSLDDTTEYIPPEE